MIVDGYDDGGAAARDALAPRPPAAIEVSEYLAGGRTRAVDRDAGGCVAELEGPSPGTVLPWPR